MGAGPVSAGQGDAGSRRPQLRGAIRLALLFYACALIVYIVSGFLRGDTDAIDIFEVGVPMMIVDGLLGFSLFFLLRATWHLPRAAAFAIIAVALVGVAAAQALVDTQLRIWAGTVWSEYGTPYLGFVRAGTLNFYHTGLFVALLAFQASNNSLREKQRQLIASRASERDAHMVALRFQLNPHFLFNTLNAISSLVIVGRAAEAEGMIERLSAFLRASLTADPRNLVRIDEEFEMLESYLEIEGVRFGDRLITAVDLPLALSGARIPPFLLQPIVENAIKYAVAPSSRPVVVRIAAEQSDGHLLLTVEDNGEGCGEAKPGTGIGLANVRERLRLKYGQAARLEKHHDAGGGCRVEILMPMDRSDHGPVAAEKSVVFV